MTDLVAAGYLARRVAPGRLARPGEAFVRDAGDDGRLVEALACEALWAVEAALRPEVFLRQLPLLYGVFPGTGS